MSRLLVCCQLDLPSVNMNACLRAQDGWEELGSDENGSYCARGDDVIMTISDKHITHEDIDVHARGFGIDVDEVVFMSKHSAASGIPTLTVHPIGNYKKADFGGRDGTLVRSAPASMSDALRKISRFNDTVIFKIEQLGAGACHTGHRSCFYRAVTPEGLQEVEETVFDVNKVYGKSSE